MDYKRIYAAFIKDRRAKETALTGYVERHHILPRSMGGGDEPDNLIRLTPEDHYFAHLLLAYGHGGKNWVAVHAMCHLSNKHSASHRSKLAARMQFGHVRRALAAHYRDVLGGAKGKISDKRQFELRNFDGRSAIGNRFELADQTGVTRHQISAVLRGAKKNAHGWYSPLHNPDGLTRSEILSQKLRSSEVVVLYHFDGRIWRGTTWDFRRDFGVGLTFQHESGCVQGWYRSEQDAKAHGTLRAAAVRSAVKARGSISGASNPNADTQTYRFRVVQSGEVIEATKVQIRERFGIKSSNLCAIFNGKQKQTGGIALA